MRRRYNKNADDDHNHHYDDTHSDSAEQSVNPSRSYQLVAFKQPAASSPGATASAERF